MTKLARIASILCLSCFAVVGQACTTETEAGFVEYGAMGDDPDSLVGQVDEQDNSLSCGNGVLEESEECDDGDLNEDNGACTASCAINVCGDGLVFDEVEECDMGELNGDNTPCDIECRAQ
jgi:cysteine-rich repeat protein